MTKVLHVSREGNKLFVQKDVLLFTENFKQSYFSMQLFHLFFFFSLPSNLASPTPTGLYVLQSLMLTFKKLEIVVQLVFKHTHKLFFPERFNKLIQSVCTFVLKLGFIVFPVQHFYLCFQYCRFSSTFPLVFTAARGGI